MSMDFYESYQYLSNKGLEIIDVSAVKVDPETEEISEFEDMNTAVRVWIEIGYNTLMTNADKISMEIPLDEMVPVSVHFWQLDSGGATFEEAIIDSARKAKDFLGKTKNG